MRKAFISLTFSHCIWPLIPFPFVPTLFFLKHSPFLCQQIAWWRIRWETKVSDAPRDGKHINTFIAVHRYAQSSCFGWRAECFHKTVNKIHFFECLCAINIWTAPEDASFHFWRWTKTMTGSYNIMFGYKPHRFIGPTWSRCNVYLGLNCKSSSTSLERSTAQPYPSVKGRSHFACTEYHLEYVVWKQDFFFGFVHFFASLHGRLRMGCGRWRWKWV